MSVWRLAADCPECGASLRLRRRRDDGSAFLGCSDFPRCRFAEDYDEVVGRVYERVAELEQEALLAPPDLGKQLRDLIALAHPDRWPDNPLAHELTARLTALRDAVLTR